MKKYEIMYKVGNLMTGAGISMMLLSFCIDVESSENAFSFSMIAIAASFMLIMVGQFICRFDSIEGAFFAAEMLVGSYLYEKYDRLRKKTKRFYLFRVQFSNSRDAFKEFVRLYINYVDTEYMEGQFSDIIDMEDYYEQSK